MNYGKGQRGFYKEMEERETVDLKTGSKMKIHGIVKAGETSSKNYARRNYKVTRLDTDRILIFKQ